MTLASINIVDNGVAKSSAITGSVAEPRSGRSHEQSEERDHARRPRLHRRPRPHRDPARTRATTVAVTRRPHRRRRPRRRARSDRPEHRSRRPGRPAAPARLPGRARPPGLAGVARRSATCTARDRGGLPLAAVAAYAAGQPGPRGSPAAAGPWRPSPAAARPRAAGRRRPRPPGLPGQPRPPRRLGQHPRPGDRRHHRGHPRPGRRPHRARRRRRPHRHAPGGRHGPGRPPHPGAHRRRPARGPAPRQRLLHSYGITGWQDAIVGATARSATPTTPTCAAAGATDRSPPVSSAPCGGTASAAPSSSPSSSRSAAGADGRTVPGRDREDHAGRRRREPHRRHAQPYLDGCGCRHGANAGHRLRRPRAARVRHRAGRARLPGALPRPRRPRRARGTRRRRGRPHRQRPHRHPPPPRPPPGRPPRRHRPLPRARRHRQHPAAVGRARTADGRADHPLPGRRTRRPGSTRSATCCGPARPVGGQRLAGQQRRPLQGIMWRSTGSPRTATRGLPARGAHRPGHRARRVHGGLGPCEPPGRHRLHRRRKLADLVVLDRDPSRARPRRSAPPGWTRHTSAAFSCTPLPPDPALRPRQHGHRRCRQRPCQRY